MSTPQVFEQSLFLFISIPCRLRSLNKVCSGFNLECRLAVGQHGIVQSCRHDLGLHILLLAEEPHLKVLSSPVESRKLERETSSNTVETSWTTHILWIRNRGKQTLPKNLTYSSQMHLFLSCKQLLGQITRSTSCCRPRWRRSWSWPCWWVSHSQTPGWSWRARRRSDPSRRCTRGSSWDSKSSGPGTKHVLSSQFECISFAVCSEVSPAESTLCSSSHSPTWFRAPSAPPATWSIDLEKCTKM